VAVHFSYLQKELVVRIDGAKATKDLQLFPQGNLDDKEWGSPKFEADSYVTRFGYLGCCFG
jgi:hypothetical protein